MQWLSWTAALSALVSLIALALGGLALIGKRGLQSREEFEKLSEARGAQLTVLESDHRRYVEEAAAKHKSYEAQIEVLTVSIEALQGTVAQLERNEADAYKRNVSLQRQLDASHEQIRLLSEQVRDRKRPVRKPDAA